MSLLRSSAETARKLLLLPDRFEVTSLDGVSLGRQGPSVKADLEGRCACWPLGEHCWPVCYGV